MIAPSKKCKLFVNMSFFAYLALFVCICRRSALFFALIPLARKQKMRHQKPKYDLFYIIYIYAALLPLVKPHNFIIQELKLPTCHQLRYGIKRVGFPLGVVRERGDIRFFNIRNNGGDIHTFV